MLKRINNITITIAIKMIIIAIITVIITIITIITIIIIIITKITIIIIIIKNSPENLDVVEVGDG